MRIEAYSQVQQIYSNNKVNKTQATQKTNDVREDLVAKYKDAIKNGTYNVSSEDFAEKILADYEAF